MSIGQRLYEARRRIGLSLEEVSSKTKIGKSSISEFENDKREPKVSHLSKLATLYARPLAYFLEEREETEPVVLWRLRPATGSEAIERKFLRLCEQYRNLEVWCDQVLDPELPAITPSNRPLTWSDVDSLAIAVRRTLNLGDRPAFTLLRALEDDCGIKIFHESFEPSGTAACIKSESYGWAVLLNRQNSPSRRPFDLAHELFHLLTWEIYRTAERNGDQTASEKEESYANGFAARLLIPEEALRRTVDRHLAEHGSLRIAVVPEIARQFGVSVEALLWRICFIYRLDGDIVRSYIESVERYTDRMPGTEDADVPKYPKRYQALSLQALHQGEISTGKYAQYMEVSRHEAVKYLATEDLSVGDLHVDVA